MALDRFMTRVKKLNLSRQNRFEVFLYGPGGYTMDRDMSLFAESISMPGQNIRSVPDDLRYGPAREQAQGMTYGPVSITFMCTPGQPEKVWFENWQKKIINKITWYSYYYKDYIGSVEMYEVDMKGIKTGYGIILNEAFPKTISGQDWSQGANDAYQTVTVEFQYRDWQEVPGSGLVADF